MKNFIKNILLLVITVGLSYYCAEFFGSWYDKFSPQYSTSWLSPGKQGLIFLVGFPFAYTFFLPLLFQLFGSENKKKWSMWLLVPPFILFGLGDLKHIYLPIIIVLLGYSLGYGIRKLLGKKD
jgi:hypothetical protein